MTEPTESIADIRAATADDEETVARMMAAFNAHEGLEHSGDHVSRAFEALREHPDWGAVLLAELGGVPAGYAVIGYSFDFEFGGRDAFLCELFVVDRFRSRGIGKALLEVAQDTARQGGAAALHLVVRPDNAAAQILYRRDGFGFDPRLLMSKPLDP